MKELPEVMIDMPMMVTKLCPGNAILHLQVCAGQRARQFTASQVPCACHARRENCWLFSCNSRGIFRYVILMRKDPSIGVTRFPSSENQDPGPGHSEVGTRNFFPPTRWTIICTAGADGTPEAEAALQDMASKNCMPV